MSDPVLNLRHFTKHVPTDMDWHGTYAGGYAEVRVHAIPRIERGPDELVGQDPALTRPAIAVVAARSFGKEARKITVGLDVAEAVVEAQRLGPGREEPDQACVVVAVDRHTEVVAVLWTLGSNVAPDYRHPENDAEGGTPVSW